MARRIQWGVARCLAPVLLLLVGASERAVTPIVHAHAHNDYEHKRPLFDALDNGFTSVEADVHLMEGKLLVAHDRSDVRPERTLQALYLDPLKKRIEANGGRVYHNGPTVVLLIDVKTDAAPTYAAIQGALKPYRPLLTSWRDNRPTTGALLVIITGNRSRNLIAHDRERYAACDGGLQDLESNPPSALVPWISLQWTRLFKWNGKGAMPSDEQQKLRDLASKCHAQHRRLRLWGSPDFPAFWAVLRDNGVDLVNTDHLPECRQFLLQRGQERKQ